MRQETRASSSLAGRQRPLCHCAPASTTREIVIPRCQTVVRNRFVRVAFSRLPVEVYPENPLMSTPVYLTMAQRYALGGGGIQPIVAEVKIRCAFPHQLDIP